MWILGLKGLKGNCLVLHWCFHCAQCTQLPFGDTKFQHSKRNFISAHIYVKASIYITQKNAFLSLTVRAILSCLLYCFTQALCKLSELDSSELTKEYKDPTDAYVIGDIIRGTYHNYVSHSLIKIWTLFNFSDTKFLMAYIFFSCRSNYKC